MTGYWIWNPAVVRRSPTVVQLFISHGERHCLATGSREFFVEAFADLDVAADPVEWTMAPLRCRYFAEPEATEWRQRYPLIWKAHVALAGDPPPLPALDAGCAATDAIDTSWTPDADIALRARARCLVIADFDTPESLGAAFDALLGAGVAPAAIALGMALGRFPSLQVDLGERDDAFYDRGALAAAELEVVCARHGGALVVRDSVRRAAQRTRLG
jgi:hypothetical protein